MRNCSKPFRLCTPKCGFYSAHLTSTLRRGSLQTDKDAKSRAGGGSVSPEGPYLQFWGNNADRVKIHFEGRLGRTNLLTRWVRIQKETKQSKNLYLQSSEIQVEGSLEEEKWILHRWSDNLIDGSCIFLVCFLGLGH